MIGKYQRRSLRITGIHEFDSDQFLRRLHKSTISLDLMIMTDTRTDIALSVWDRSIFRENNAENKLTILKKLLDGCSFGDSIIPIVDNNKALIHVVGLPVVRERQIEEIVKKLIDLEDKILENIKDEKLKQLAFSIDTNPKYILSALEALKICKISKALQDDEKWEDMEHLITLVFRHLYATDVKHGGTKQKGKSVPDNVFFVRDKDGIYLTGVVDCKYSKSADLSQEKTEKHIGYLERVRTLSMKTEKKVLIFPVLDVKSKSTVNEFYNRIEKDLEKGEYVVILPIDTLIVLMRTYLSIILKGKIDLKSSDFHDLIIHLFDKDFLNKITKSESNLFSLEYELIIVELKKRVEDLSIIETAFEEIYK